MKRLVLIRHAKSSWANPHLKDFDRPLNKRGKRDAPFMADQLKKKGIKPDLIVSSPAKRAKKTAKKIAKGVGYEEDAIVKVSDIYAASTTTLLAVIQNIPEDVNTLFLVGHNYELTDLAEMLTGEGLVNVPTCGIVSINYASSSWESVGTKRGKMDFFDYPKKHVRVDESDD